MGSPVAVRDVILLSQIAFKLGQAFTSGRKSAPAEFVDVQRLLFTLSSALNAFADTLPGVKNEPATLDEHLTQGSGTARATNVLGDILGNCRSILEHLQMLVDKYSEIGPKERSPDNGANSSFRRWKDDLRKNWKKVTWTREGGGLDKLKITLDVHISGLNLAMAALNKQQMSSLDAKLEEIYQWFQANLKERPTPTATTRPIVTASTPQPKLRLTFTVWLEAPDAPERSLCCRSASFTEGWLDAAMQSPIRRRVFQCHCKHSCHSQDAPCTEPQIHHHKLDFTLLDVSLLVRLPEPANEREWQMYVCSAAYTQEVSIVINNVPPQFTANFEVKASLLATLQARLHLSKGFNTMLVAASVEDAREIVSTLNMKSSSSALNQGILSMSFNSKGRTFIPKRIESIQLLHHRPIYADDLMGSALETTADMIRDRSYAEPVVHCAAATTYGEEVAYLVQLAPDTQIFYGEDERNVCLKDVYASKSRLPSRLTLPAIRQRKSHARQLRSNFSLQVPPIQPCIR